MWVGGELLWPKGIGIFLFFLCFVKIQITAVSLFQAVQGKTSAATQQVGSLLLLLLDSVGIHNKVKNRATFKDFHKRNVCVQDNVQLEKH